MILEAGKMRATVSGVATQHNLRAGNQLEGEFCGQN
jgi:hypothetical protein